MISGGIVTLSTAGMTAPTGKRETAMTESVMTGMTAAMTAGMTIAEMITEMAIDRMAGVVNIEGIARVFNESCEEGAEAIFSSLFFV